LCNALAVNPSSRATWLTDLPDCSTIFTASAFCSAVKLLFGFVVMIVLLDLHCILWRTVYFTATRSHLGLYSVNYTIRTLAWRGMWFDRPHTSDKNPKKFSFGWWVGQRWTQWEIGAIRASANEVASKQSTDERTLGMCLRFPEFFFEALAFQQSSKKSKASSHVSPRENCKYKSTNIEWKRFPSTGLYFLGNLFVLVAQYRCQFNG
jgi:hypothetical protein